jgi:hypothetical protein
VAPFVVQSAPVFATPLGHAQAFVVIFVVVVVVGVVMVVTVVVVVVIFVHSLFWRL